MAPLLGGSVDQPYSDYVSGRRKNGTSGQRGRWRDLESQTPDWQLGTEERMATVTTSETSSSVVGGGGSVGT